jgi:hypothetical protein
MQKRHFQLNLKNEKETNHKSKKNLLPQREKKAAAIIFIEGSIYELKSENMDMDCDLVITKVASGKRIKSIP